MSSSTRISSFSLFWASSSRFFAIRISASSLFLASMSMFHLVSMMLLVEYHVVAVQVFFSNRHNARRSLSTEMAYYQPATAEIAVTRAAMTLPFSRRNPPTVDRTTVTMLLHAEGKHQGTCTLGWPDANRANSRKKQHSTCEEFKTAILVTACLNRTSLAMHDSISSV
uniref:Uncharacterized protein n=1 Tax=Hemiselmis andersenii TaxID=464988 RepID=A0A6T8MCK3_HEMAN